MVDGEIGKVLDALDETGLWESTVVIFTSDHGDGQGAHHWNQKWCLYDESVRVPFIVAAPGGRVGQVDGRLVSAGLDVVPTICDYAGIQPPGGIHGLSVRPLVEGRDTPDWRTFVASETSFGNWGTLWGDDYPKARMIRTGRYKYVAYDAANPREQLCDLERDPGEMTNLAGAPELAAVLQARRAHLRAWCRRTADAFEGSVPNG
jgi:arylsulfatase A-like enzyme